MESGKMTGNQHPAIEVRNVSKRFGQIVALDNVSFSVKAGELFFLLGPSGCGKTTMLRILAGLETPDSGAISLGGRDVSEVAPYRRGAPMVFQNYALWPHMTVRDNIAFGLVERKTPGREIRKRVDEILDRVNLRGFGDRKPAQLSGGQQQRVVLARALVLNPEVILLDEPLSNLDAKLRAEMREEIENLHRETDITFVYVTHDQTEALSLADRMAVMDRGRIRATGAPLDLYHRPPNLFCGSFLGEANLVPGRVVGTQEGFLRVETPFGAWLATRAGEAQPRAGDSVNCLIRPENLHCAPGASVASNARLNTLEAEVAAVRMTGSTVTVVLRSGTMNLKATLLNEYPVDPKSGTKAMWTADAKDTVVVAE